MRLEIEEAMFISEVLKEANIKGRDAVAVGKMISKLSKEVERLSKKKNGNLETITN